MELICCASGESTRNGQLEKSKRKKDVGPYPLRICLKFASVRHPTRSQVTHFIDLAQLSNIVPSLVIQFRLASRVPNMAESSMNQEGLSLKETNKMRISLGLKPIGAEVEDGEEAPVDEDDLAEANFAQRKQEMKKAKEETDLKERIAK